MQIRFGLRQIRFHYGDFIIIGLNSDYWLIKVAPRFVLNGLLKNQSYTSAVNDKSDLSNNYWTTQSVKSLSIPLIIYFFCSFISSSIVFQNSSLTASLRLPFSSNHLSLASTDLKTKIHP